MPPERGEAARDAGHILRRKCYYTQTCSGNLRFVCNKYGVPWCTNFPFWGGFGPSLEGCSPFGVRRYFSCGPAYLCKFWSIWDKSSGWQMQIYHFPIPLLTTHPLNSWKTFCGVMCLMDAYRCAIFHPSVTNAVVAIHLCHLRMHVRTYLRTTLTVPIMRLAAFALRRALIVVCEVEIQSRHFWVRFVSHLWSIKWVAVNSDCMWQKCWTSVSSQLIAGSRFKKNWKSISLFIIVVVN